MLNIWLTTKEAASMMGVTQQAIIKWIKIGTIRCEKVPQPNGHGSMYLIDPISLEQAAASNSAAQRKLDKDNTGYRSMMVCNVCKQLKNLIIEMAIYGRYHIVNTYSPRGELETVRYTCNDCIKEQTN